MNQRNQTLCVLGAIAVVGGMATRANADISYAVSDVSLEVADVQYADTYGGAASSMNVLAGGIGITANGSTGGVAPSSYVSVCTDFNGSLYLGSSYTYNAPISTSLATTTPGYSPDPGWGQDAAAANKAIQNAATLFANYNSALTSGNYDSAAGLQLAIWTALYDTTDTGSVNTSTGARFLGLNDGSDAAAIAAMNAYLGDLPGLTPDTTVEIFTPSPDTAQGNPDGNPPQGLLYAPVPEASTVVTATLLLLSFGMCSLKSFGKFRA